MPRISGSSSVMEGVLIDWSLEQPVDIPGLPVGLLSREQVAAELVRRERRKAMDAAYEAVSKGAAQSWQMDNRWKTMAEGKFDFGFAVDWMRKDLGLVLEEARANGSHLALTALVDQFYSEVQALGGARWDTSSLAARLQDRSKP